MDSKTAFLCDSPGSRTEKNCGFSLWGCSFFVCFFFLITLFRVKFHHGAISHTPACHLTSSSATSPAFHLTLLFFFFHILTNYVSLPTAGIYYLWETRAAPLQSSFLFFLKKQPFNAQARCCLHVRYVRSLQTWLLALMQMAAQAIVYRVSILLPGVCSLPESCCEQSAPNTKTLIKI